MLKRNLDNKVLLGVCAGLSDYYNIDVTLIRIIFIVTTLLFGIGLIIYLILGFIMTIEEENPKTIKNSKKVEFIDPEKNVKNSAYILLTIGVIILLFYTPIVQVFYNGIFWGIFFILLALSIILKKKTFSVPMFIVVLIISIILTIIVKDLGYYLAQNLPYPYNNYF